VAGQHHIPVEQAPGMFCDMVCRAVLYCCAMLRRAMLCSCRQAKEDSLAALPVCVREWGPAAVKPHLQAVSHLI
jgi:hypothetical protein